VPLSDHVVAGYYLARPGPRQEAMTDAAERPPSVASASSCLGLFAPDTWCLEWASGETEASRGEQATALGIDPGRVPALVRWFTERVDRDGAFFPNLLATLEHAREFRELARPEREDVRTYALALPRSEVDRFLADSTPDPSPPGFAPIAEPGAATGIRRGRAPQASGVPLGYEPLTSDVGCGPSCSWACTASQAGVREELGITANAHGLIDSAADAIRVCRWFDEGQGRAEPGPWFPWLLVRYD
jgi:hypothetical protein